MATVTFKNDTVCKLAGNEVNVGDKAPEVTVVNCDPMLQDEKVGGEGKVQLVVAVPSLDTGVCDAETRRFNTEAANLDGVEVVTVSMDLPFLQLDGVVQLELTILKCAQILEIKILVMLMVFF